MAPFPNRDNIILKFNVNNKPYTIYVIKRPFVDEFLYEMSLCYDIIIFTASLKEYTTSLIPIIDKYNWELTEVVNDLYKVNSKELCFNGTLNRNKSKLLKKI